MSLSVEKLSEEVYLVRYHPNNDVAYSGVFTLVCKDGLVTPKGFIMPEGTLPSIRRQFQACVKALKANYKSERKWRANQT